MKQNRIMFAALAIAALLMTSCGKDPQVFSSFTLSTADFTNANGTKAVWDADGYWWNDIVINSDDSNSCDKVLINGIMHKIFHDTANHVWKTRGNAVSPDEDYFYVVYDGGTPNSTKWNGSDHTYGSVNFNGSFVPLAAKGKGNSLTLEPCCAVIMSKDYDHVDFTFFDEGGNEIDGIVYDNGYINADDATVSGSTPVSSIDASVTVGGYNYFIIPMGDNTMRASLMFNFEKETDGAVQINKGVVYKID